VATQNAVAMAVWKGKLYMAWRGPHHRLHLLRGLRLGDDLPQPTQTKSFLIPIINIHTRGPYTASVLVGSQQDQANVIVDTGSSTLAVLPSKYKALARHRSGQDVAGSAGPVWPTWRHGWWYGPVVETRLAIQAVDGPSLVVHQDTTSIGIAVGNAASPQHIFQTRTAFMGLAYK